MTDSPDTQVDARTGAPPAFPDTMGNGSTVLVAGTVDPSTYALGLRALCQYGRGAESAFVVTTTASADRTCADYEALSSGDAPSLGLVDTTSRKQYVTAFYGNSPTVFTPSSADLEQIVVALSELAGGRLPAAESRHLVVRSLTPVLDYSSSTRVGSVLQRITGLRTGNGIGFFGLRYTEHDEETVAVLAQHVDGILWVTRGPDHELDFDYQSARRYSAHSRAHAHKP